MNKKTILVLIIIFSFISSIAIQIDFIRSTLNVSSGLFLFLSAFPALYGLKKSTAWKKFLLVFLVLTIYSIILETVAIQTGFPYGKFEYTEVLGFKIGIVPLSLPFAWIPLVLGAFFIGKTMSKNFLGSTILGIISLVGIDLVLDPGAVYLNFWVWENQDGFYGVPWSNFLGWIFSSTFAILFLNIFFRSENKLSDFLVYSYLSSLCFWIGINLFASQWIAVLIGIIIFIFSIYSIKKDKLALSK